MTKTRADKLNITTSFGKEISAGKYYNPS